MPEVIPERVFNDLCTLAAEQQFRWDMRDLHPRGNRVWMDMFRNYFSVLAQREPAEYDRRVPNREWLLDACWTHGDHRGMGFRGITLAVESEGGQADEAVLEDLHKLLAVCTDTRVFIFSSYSANALRIVARRRLVQDAIAGFGGLPSGELTAILFAQAADQHEAWTAYCDVYSHEQGRQRVLAPFRCVLQDWALVPFDDPIH
jgi:hypothetical protein